MRQCCPSLVTGSLIGFGQTEGFEPSKVCTLPGFNPAALGHSAHVSASGVWSDRHKWLSHGVTGGRTVAEHQ